MSVIKELKVNGSILSVYSLFFTKNPWLRKYKVMQLIRFTNRRNIFIPFNVFSLFFISQLNFHSQVECFQN